MPTVVVADDNIIVRRGIAALLRDEGEADVVAEVGSLPELLEAVQQHRPQVVVTDVRMPPTGTDEGIRAAEELAVSHPDLAVVVLSQYADPTFLRRLVAGGTARRGYLLKDNVATPGELTHAVRQAAGGGSFIDPFVVETPVSARPSSSSSAVAWRCSPT